MSYVVVIFGGPAEDWCDLNYCPMHAIGPFTTSDAAKALADQLPAWQRAHVLSVEANPAPEGGPVWREAARRIWQEVEYETRRLGGSGTSPASPLIDNWLGGMREAAKILDGTSTHQRIPAPEGGETT